MYQIASDSHPSRLLSSSFVLVSSSSTYNANGSAAEEPIYVPLLLPHLSRYTSLGGYKPVRCDSLSGAPPPRSRPHLSLELGECLGSGRTAVVYAARIVEIAPGGSASDCPKPTVQDPELCVKIARPNRSRTLAREAWVYDQQGPLQGVCVPRCYGFFSATLSAEQLPVGLWDPCEELEDDDPTCDDPLPDDDPEDSDCEEVSPGARECSEWVDWKPNPDAPLLSVLVTVRGGPRYTNRDHRDADTQHEIYEILDDLSAAYILHCDLRPVNIVRAPKSTEVCERHKRVHKWNLIDFAWSTVDQRDPVPGLRLEAIQRHQRVPYRTVYFIHGRVITRKPLR